MLTKEVTFCRVDTFCLHAHLRLFLLVAAVKTSSQSHTWLVPAVEVQVRALGRRFSILLMQHLQF